MIRVEGTNSSCPELTTPSSPGEMGSRWVVNLREKRKGMMLFSGGIILGAASVISGAIAPSIPYGPIPIVAVIGAIFAGVLAGKGMQLMEGEMRMLRRSAGL